MTERRGPRGSQGAKEARGVTPSERRLKTERRLRAMCHREALAMAGESGPLADEQLVVRAARLRAYEEALRRVHLESRSRRSWMIRPTGLILSGAAIVSMVMLWSLWYRKDPVEARLSVQCSQFSCVLAPESASTRRFFPLFGVSRVDELAMEGRISLIPSDDLRVLLGQALSLGDVSRVSVIGKVDGLELESIDCPSHVQIECRASGSELSMTFNHSADPSKVDQSSKFEIAFSIPCGTTIRLEGSGGSFDRTAKRDLRLKLSSELGPGTHFSLQLTPAGVGDPGGLGSPLSIGLEGFRASRLSFWSMDARRRQQLPGGDSTVISGVVSIPGTDLPDHVLEYRQPIYSPADGVRESPLQSVGTLNWVRLVPLDDDSPHGSGIALSLDWEGAITNGRIGHLPNTVDLSPRLLFWCFGDAQTLYVTGLAVYGFVLVSALLRRSVPGVSDAPLPGEGLL